VSTSSETTYSKTRAKGDCLYALRLLGAAKSVSSSPTSASLVVRGERIIDSATYSAVVIMVMLTTLITPPALKWSLGRDTH